jgi:hypothetical protein
VTFIQLKPRLINILMNALQVETDAQNTHMLLGGLLLTVQDAVAFEESEQSGSDLLQPSPADGNLLSSGMRVKTTKKSKIFSIIIFFKIRSASYRLFSLFCLFNQPTNLFFLCHIMVLYVFRFNILCFSLSTVVVFIIIETASNSLFGKERLFHSQCRIEF